MRKLINRVLKIFGYHIDKVRVIDKFNVLSISVHFGSGTWVTNGTIEHSRNKYKLNRNRG